ncbi:SRPBCC domain-containing protein [Calidifontibacillus erzurumensis]|uniref:SRPBCC domain-containing protein n=1 Tax=Calidifontibacillus erzurumensis TaxID=2741433 RepID=A0A8J8GEG8_9BACI|nr:SRPBCC domain-containing protein [Calidifontibacillus erzurumensis]NSL51867.1 SRPBCC domain-containing protein [Calidifontibacillus erzurumensis]
MTNKLVVKDEILIDAAPSKVWEVLTYPKYVAQWDELPEDYPTEQMGVGSKVVWDLPNGGQTITTIIKAEEMEELKIALYVSTWEEKTNEGDVAYTYKLDEVNGNTLLKIEIGDFALLTNGQDYYDASVQFASEAKKVIKELAESL